MDLSLAEVRVVLDLSRLEYISSAGFRILLLAAKRAQAENPEAAAAAEQTALEAEAAAPPVAEEVDDSDLYNINNFTI